MMRGHAIGRCRGCDAAILWVRTPSGRGMPCNPDLVSAADLSVGSKIVTKDGIVFTIKKQREGFETFGYVPHWATCPKAGEFRKRKQGAE